MPILSKVELVEQDLELLTGQANYCSWQRDIRLVAEAKGLYGFWTGDTEVLLRPVEKEYISVLDSIKESTVQIARYHVAIARYEENAAKYREAKAFLLAHIHPGFRTAVQLQSSLTVAWLYLDGQYKLSYHDANDLARTTMSTLRVDDFENMSAYLNAFEVRNWYYETSNFLTDTELIRVTIAGLSPLYHDCTKDLLEQRPDLTFTDLRNILIVAEAKFRTFEQFVTYHT